MREIRLSGSMSGDWKREPIKDLPRQSSTLQNYYFGSGGVICTNSTAVVHFSNIDRRKIRREDIPTHCGRGHPLTPENLRIDRSEQRWRCLQCGRDRAAAFRRRHGRAAQECP